MKIGTHFGNFHTSSDCFFFCLGKGVGEFSTSASGPLKSIPTADNSISKSRQKILFSNFWNMVPIVKEPIEVKCLKGMRKGHFLAGKEKRMLEEEEIADMTARNYQNHGAPWECDGPGLYSSSVRHSKLYINQRITIKFCPRTFQEGTPLYF